VICKKGELTPLVAAFAALPADDVRVPRCNDVIALMMETCVVGRTRGLHTLARDARSGSELHPPLPRRRSRERDTRTRGDLRRAVGIRHAARRARARRGWQAGRHAGGGRRRAARWRLVGLTGWRWLQRGACAVSGSRSSS